MLQTFCSNTSTRDNITGSGTRNDLLMIFESASVKPDLSLHNFNLNICDSPVASWSKPRVKHRFPREPRPVACVSHESSEPSSLSQHGFV